MVPSGSLCDDFGALLSGNAWGHGLDRAEGSAQAVAGFS